MPIRKIIANLEEEERACSHCGKSLVGECGMLYIVLPGMQTTLEFCSWFCLFTYVSELLKRKTFDVRLLNNDLLSNLGCDRDWGKIIPKEELEAPIVDPIEDLPTTKIKDSTDVKNRRSKSKRVKPPKEG